MNGDATVGSRSVIRGSFNSSGPGCDWDEIWFVGGFGTTWKVLLTPYRGRVLAATSSPARSCCSRPARASTWASTRAVWTEQVDPGGEFAQTELFQAKTYSNDLARTPRPHLVAWLRNGQVFESDDRSGSFQHKAGDRLPDASRMRPIVLGTRVLMASATRIYARTEVL